MPFKVVGNYVVSAITGEKKNKKPLSKERLRRYLAALYANVPEARTKKTAFKSFMGHRGRPGKVGGSLPRTAAGVMQTSNVLGMRTASLKAATSSIDHVHSVEGIKPVKYYESGKILKGYQGGYNATKRIIVVNSQGKYKGLTATHEFGHVLESEAFKSPNLKAKVDNIYKTMDNTAGVKLMRKAKLSKKMKIGNKTYIVGGNVFGYYLRREEMFARGYAQYIASKRGNRTLYNELVQRRKFPLNGQWAQSDFAQVSRAYDELFTEAGWLK